MSTLSISDLLPERRTKSVNAVELKKRIKRKIYDAVDAKMKSMENTLQDTGILSVIIRITENDLSDCRDLHKNYQKTCIDFVIKEIFTEEELDASFKIMVQTAEDRIIPSYKFSAQIDISYGRINVDC